MANSNSLEGMACPVCKSEGPFNIVISACIEVSDEGTNTDNMGDHIEWAPESSCSCVKCGAGGTVAGFYIDYQSPKKEEPMQHVFVVANKITARMICDLLVTAIESGGNDWLKKVDYKGTKTTANSHWYDDPEIIDGSFLMEVRYDDPDGGDEDGEATKTVGLADIQIALQKMAEEFPSHFSDLVAENSDMNTADNFMQLLVMGDEVYS